MTTMNPTFPVVMVVISRKRRTTTRTSNQEPQQPNPSQSSTKTKSATSSFGSTRRQRKGQVWLLRDSGQMFVKNLSHQAPRFPGIREKENPYHHRLIPTMSARARLALKQAFASRKKGKLCYRNCASKRSLK